MTTDSRQELGQIRPVGCVLEAGDCADDLARRLRVVAELPELVPWIAVSGSLPTPLRGVAAKASARILPLSPSTGWARWLDVVDGDPVALIPVGADLGPAVVPDPRTTTVTVWPPGLALPERTARPVASPATACWISRDLLLSLDEMVLEVPPGLAGLGGPVALVETLRQGGIQVRWGSPRPDTASVCRPRAQSGSGGIRRTDRVCAVVPHFGCERWLAQCLESLQGQTRRLDGVVVIDDASAEPPVDLVRRFPEVTLLRSDVNVGPYRLVQTLIDATRFDAYLFQDADDWSTADRLALLLDEAERTGAELIGGQELRVLSSEGDTLRPVLYPLDVNRALAESPGHPLLHPTSLVSRDLVQRVGGFATTLRFGGDTEFLLRAVFHGRIVNVPEIVYLRRHRPRSLTTAAATGLGSPAREALLRRVKERARSNLEAARQGRPVDPRPLDVAGPVELAHLTGPSLPELRARVVPAEASRSGG